MYLDEMAVSLSPTGTEAGKELRLLLNCLYMISRQKADLRVIKAVFELRTMSECGFLPQLACCNACGKYDDASFYLDPQEAICSAGLCAEGREAVQPGRRCAVCVAAHLPRRGQKNICIQDLGRSLAKLSAVAEQYALTHLDKPLKSYSFLKSVLP